MRLRCVLVSVLSVAMLPAAGWGQSALQQLEDMTGQKVDTFQGSSSYQPAPARVPQSAPKKTQLTSQQMQMNQMMGSMLGDMLFNALFPTSGKDPAAAAMAEKQRQQAIEEQQRALQAWANAYSQHMNQLLSEQRQLRTQQNADSLENLTSALSAPFDGRQGTAPPGGGGLASALLDPAPVVDLSDSTSFTPSLLRDENGALRSKQVTPDEVLKRRQEAQARLKAMMEEDQDMNRLGQRFYELEARLDKLKENAACLGGNARSIADDYNRWGRQVDEAVQAALERGVSMLDGALIPKGTSMAMDKLRSNPAAWNETMESFAQLNKFTDFVNEVGDRYDTAHETLDWLAAKRNLYRDLDFLAEHVGPLTTQYSLGKNIVASGLNVAQELDAWGNMNEAAGDQSLLKLRQQAVQAQMVQLVRELQASRAVLADKLHVRPEDLIPAGPRNAPPVPPLCPTQ